MFEIRLGVKYPSRHHASKIYSQIAADTSSVVPLQRYSPLLIHNIMLTQTAYFDTNNRSNQILNYHFLLHYHNSKTEVFLRRWSHIYETVLLPDCNSIILINNG